MNIVITGRPGIGKTTLIKELAEELAEKADGFYTEEIRQHQKRVGFKIKTLKGKSGILASVDINTRFKVGRYKVNLEGFERIAIPVMEDALDNAKIILIDEIGPMELFSEIFRRTVLKTFDSPNPVIATIKLKGSKFINEIKNRKDVLVYTLRFNNKKTILEEILKRLSNL